MTENFLAEPASANRTASSFTRHRGPVTGVAAQRTSPWVITSAYDGAVASFNRETHAVRPLGYHDHLVNRVICDTELPRAASCSSDYTIRLWDLTHSRCSRVLLGHSDDVEDFVFVDAWTGVSASRDHRILVWDLETGAIQAILEGHEKDVLSLAYHEGKLYSSGDDMTLRVWDLATGAQLNLWGPFEVETDTCAIDPIHDRVVLGCDDGCIRIFEISSGRSVATLEAHASGIKKVAVSPATGDLLSAAYDQRVVIWDGSTLEPIRVAQSPASTWERSLIWSPDGAHLLGGTFDGTVLLWDAATGELEAEIGERAESEGNACFNEVASTGAGHAALVSDDGWIRQIRLAPGETALSSELVPPTGRTLMNAITADPDLGRVVAGSHDGKIHLFDLTAGGLQHLTEVALGEGPINSIRIATSPGHEGEIFVGCYESPIVRLSPEGEILTKIQVHEGAVKALRLHPSQSVGVSCGADGMLLSWTIDGEKIHEFLGHTAIINDVDLSPSGETVASVSRDFTLKIYDFATGSLIETFALGRRSLKSVCFADSKTVVIGDYWGAAIRVNLETGEVQRVTVAANGISSVTRSGEHVAASSYDGATYLLRPEDLGIVASYRHMQQRLDLRAVS